MKRGLPIAPVAALLLLLPPSAAAAPRTHVVVIDNMKFGAMPAEVSAGDSILWINKDIFRHTATARNGSFNVDLPAGARAKTVARKTGATVVTCHYHPGMRAMLRISQ